MKGFIENYTPHPVHIYEIDNNGHFVGPLITLEPNKNGSMWLNEDRVDWSRKVPVHGCSVTVIKPATYVGVENMPQMRDLNVIVSALVADYLVKHHADHFNHIYTPDTGPGGVVRDERGQIKGTTRLIQYK